MTNYPMMELRLCDDDGMVSHEAAPNCRPPKSYLDVLNMLRRHTKPFGEHRPVEKPFACTGSAHLWGKHIRCTSPAHLSQPVRPQEPSIASLNPCATCGWSAQFCGCGQRGEKLVITGEVASRIAEILIRRRGDDE